MVCRGQGGKWIGGEGQMMVGDKSINGEVVYIRGKYYIAKLTRVMDNQILYRVFIDDDYWRNKAVSQYAHINLEECINWIGKRRCFHKKEIIDGIEITDDMTDEYIAYLRGEIPDPRD